MGQVVYLCRGSGCKKRKAENKSLRQSVGGSLEIEEVRCQKICKGPVAGVEVGGTLRWFRKLDPRTDLVDLRRAIEDGCLPKKLAKKQVEKRTGKLR
ncbi:MAG: (2Fe-2S) ferredoxin domain-containing protein [Deltaproteobacteria bacterium]|nr:(2Fe-2S) ferredoxin domain-containing protein [Deltaproteobacteria bacterium]